MQLLWWNFQEWDKFKGSPKTETQCLSISDQYYMNVNVYKKLFPNFWIFLGEKILCKHCGVAFHKYSLKRHIKNQHQATETLQCSYCSKISKNEASLNEHMRSAHGVYKSKRCWSCSWKIYHVNALYYYLFLNKVILKMTVIDNNFLNLI